MPTTTKRPGLPARIAYTQDGKRYPAWVAFGPTRVECLAGLVGRAAYVWVVLDYKGVKPKDQPRHSERVLAVVARLKKRGWRHVETAGAAHAPA